MARTGFVVLNTTKLKFVVPKPWFLNRGGPWTLRGSVDGSFYGVRGELRDFFFFFLNDPNVFFFFFCRNNSIINSDDSESNIFFFHPGIRDNVLYLKGVHDLKFWLRIPVLNKIGLKKKMDWKNTIIKYALNMRWTL